MSLGLPAYCRDCGTPLRPDNPGDQCLECRIIAINERHAAYERERRRAIVAERLAALETPPPQEGTQP